MISRVCQAQLRGLAGLVRLTLLLLLLFFCGTAQAQSKRLDVEAAHKAACVEAYESAQEAKVESRLKDARRELRVCAQTQCPEFIRADCAQWFGDVQEAMPSVVISAVDPRGSDTTEVRVSIDGKLVAQRLDGAALELDPGEHQFRFEHADEDAIELNILIRAGEKNRPIQASWREGDSQVWDQGRGQPGPLRPYAYVMGGIAGAGLVSFGVFGILGHQQEKSVEKKCEADLVNCPVGEIDDAEQKLLIADVSLGIAAASLLAGVTLFVLSEPDDETGAPSDTGVRVDLGLAGSGVGAQLKGSF